MIFSVEWQIWLVLGLPLEFSHKSWEQTSHSPALIDARLPCQKPYQLFQLCSTWTMRKGPVIASFAIIYLFDSPEMINILRHPDLWLTSLACIWDAHSGTHLLRRRRSGIAIQQACCTDRFHHTISWSWLFYRIVLFSPSKSFSPVSHASGDGQPHTRGYHHSRIFGLLIQELQGWGLGLLSRRHVVQTGFIMSLVKVGAFTELFYFPFKNPHSHLWLMLSEMIKRTLFG